MEKYTEFQKEQLKIADIILLVYDVTDQQSFEDIEKWFELIKQNSLRRKVVLTVIANKIDLSNDRIVNK